MPKKAPSLSTLDEKIQRLTQKRKDVIEETCNLFSKDVKRILKAKKAFDLDLKTFSKEFSSFIDQLQKKERNKHE